MLNLYFFFFFFFQAEDGIRDATVTGVQTCALPIFRAPGVSLTRLERPEDLLHVASQRGATTLARGVGSRRGAALTCGPLRRRSGATASRSMVRRRSPTSASTARTRRAVIE